MNNKAFELLQHIAEQADKSGVVVPLLQQERTEWRGVGFRVANHSFIAPMGEVDEILYLPQCTKVPGVKNWVSGVANVRGRLLAVIDLGDYFGGRPAHLNKSARVLAIKKGDLYTGVIVDEVLGMQTFTADKRTQSKGVPAQFQPFVSGAFVAGDKHWNIFSLYKLAATPQFLQVAV